MRGLGRAVVGRLRARLLDTATVEDLFDRFRRRLLEEHSIWGPRERVHLAPTAQVNDALFNVSSGEIVVGEHVIFGHGVAVITGTHDPNRLGEERARHWPLEGRDVHIAEGVWIGSGAIVLGPCRIGRHAVVGAGSVVRSDVDPFTLVAGVPAKAIRAVGDAPT